MAKGGDKKVYFQWRWKGTIGDSKNDSEFVLEIEKGDLQDTIFDDAIDDAMRGKLLSIKPSKIPDLLDYHLKKTNVSDHAFFYKIDLLSSTLTENAKSYDAFQFMKASEPKAKEVIEKWLKYQEDHVDRISTRITNDKILAFFKKEFENKLSDEEINSFVHATFAQFQRRKPPVTLNPEMSQKEIKIILRKIYNLDKEMKLKDLVFHFQRSFTQLANYDPETIYKNLPKI